MNDLSADRLFAEKVTAMITENQNLRVKSDNDEKTIFLQTEQYNALAAKVNSIRDDAASRVAKALDDCDRQVTGMAIERDQAIAKYKRIDTLLMQAADLIMQAARARTGDETPEKMPQVQLPNMQDDRLPSLGPITEGEHDPYLHASGSG